MTAANCLFRLTLAQNTKNISVTNHKEHKYIHIQMYQAQIQTGRVHLMYKETGLGEKP